VPEKGSITERLTNEKPSKINLQKDVLSKKRASEGPHEGKGRRGTIDGDV